MKAAVRAPGDERTCVNTAMPITAAMRLLPERERSPMVTLRPPASSSPAAMMAPILHMVSSCLSWITLSSCVNASQPARRLGLGLRVVWE